MNNQLSLIDLVPSTTATSAEATPGAAKRSDAEDKNPAQIDTKSFKMLAMNANPAVVQVMLEFARVSLEQIRYFAGPLVMYSEM